MTKCRHQRKAKRKAGTQKCPTPRKLCYSSEAHAMEVITAAEFPTDRKPHRAYLCRCGSWHTTSSRKSRRR